MNCTRTATSGGDDTTIIKAFEPQITQTNDKATQRGPVHNAHEIKLRKHDPDKMGKNGAWKRGRPRLNKVA